MSEHVGDSLLDRDCERLVTILRTALETLAAEVPDEFTADERQELALVLISRMVSAAFSNPVDGQQSASSR